MNGTPYDYSDRKIKVYFEVGGLDIEADGIGRRIKDVIEGLDYIDELEYKGYGFYARIAIQQIPSVICDLVKSNIAIYAVEREK